MSTKQKNVVTSEQAAVINDLQMRLDDAERKLADALARLDDALKQTSDFIPHGEDPLLDLTEAGELVGRSHQTIRNMINQRMLRCVQEPGGLMRVRKSSLTKLYAEALLIDEETRDREERQNELRRQEAERLALEQADDSEIEKPPEGGDTYVNPVLLALKREREQDQSVAPDTFE